MYARKGNRFLVGAAAVSALALCACSPAAETAGGTAAETASGSAGETASAPAGGDGATFTYTSDQDTASTQEGAEFAGGDTATAEEGTRVAVVLKALSNQYWQGIELGVRAAAEDFGVEVTLQAASSESAQTEQLTIAQTLVGQDFDAYVVAPESTSNLEPALEQMREQGAPIVNVDDARVAATAYVGPDHELDGSRAAERLAEANPDGGAVAQIEGQAGSSAAILRIAGFEEGVQQSSGLELVASVPGEWDANTAFGATQQVLRQNPELVGIYANNDTMAIGVVSALQESGAIDQVDVIGTDGVPEAIASIREGEMEATLSPLPYYEGYWAVEAAVRLLNGEDVAEWIQAPAQLITSDNVDEFYDEDGGVRTDLFE